MLVYPIPYVAFVALALALGAWVGVRAGWFGAYPWIGAWLWFNVFIAVYEVYIVWNRAQVGARACPVDFWTTPKPLGAFWMDAWREYSCQSDRRYLDPRDFVFWIEFGNVLWVVLLAAALVSANSVGSAKPLWIGVVLILQAYHCLIYFITLYHSQKYTFLNPFKAWFYLAISALWIIIPLVCIRTLL